MEDAIVLYPSPTKGHIVSMVELGKLILHQHPSFCITILVIPVPTNTDYIERISVENPSMNFYPLPHVPISSSSSKDLLGNYLTYLQLYNSNVHQVLQSISQKFKLRAFIADFFCNAAFEVSSSLNIPTYYFVTSGTSYVSILLYFTTIHETTDKSIRDLNAYCHFPGTPPIFSSDMPHYLLDRNSSSYNHFTKISTQMSKSQGIIVNSFETLEPRAAKAIADGLCVPGGDTPRLYCIGPLLSSSSNAEEHECIRWLNLQPSKSVVFICFGSVWSLNKEQLTNMAIGLENSRHRFLWVVRSPSDDNGQLERAFAPPPEPDLEAILPQGFLDRTKDRGLVLKSWAPQVAILNHHSVGGFVTHCGWNSILEAVCAGVPMLAWPLQAEQKANRVILVEELKLGLALNESENGFVNAAELKTKVGELMESKSGKAVRGNILAMKEAAKAAIAPGGCSKVAIEGLVTLWKQD